MLPQNGRLITESRITKLFTTFYKVNIAYCFFLRVLIMIVTL